MKIGDRNFPLLKCCKKNYLTEPENIVATDEWDLMLTDIEKELQLYKGQKLQINYVTRPIHEKLIDINNFIKAKTLLKDLPESYGYLILPEKMKPRLVQDTEDLDLDEFSFDSVLFSFVNQETHDLNHFGKIQELSIEGEEDEEEKEDRESYLAGRWLTVLPIKNGEIKYCLRDSNASVSDEFGIVHGHETWDAYGNILDYIFSFLIFYNFTETENKTIFGIDSGKARKVKIDDEKYLNETQNDIEIIDATYFTRIIRTGEFGVSGHFRLQRYGANNSLVKLIYIKNFKKNGYVREARQELKK